jgi:hypothetical protein
VSDAPEPMITIDAIKKYLNSDNVEMLKLQIRESTLVMLAIMDTLGVSEIKLSKKTLTETEGVIESYYDFESNSYIFRRIKK